MARTVWRVCVFRRANKRHPSVVSGNGVLSQSDRKTFWRPVYGRMKSSGKIYCRSKNQRTALDAALSCCERSPALSSSSQEQRPVPIKSVPFVQSSSVPVFTDSLSLNFQLCSGWRCAMVTILAPIVQALTFLSTILASTGHVSSRGISPAVFILPLVMTNNGPSCPPQGLGPNAAVPSGAYEYLTDRSRLSVRFSTLVYYT